MERRREPAQFPNPRSNSGTRPAVADIIPCSLAFLTPFVSAISAASQLRLVLNTAERPVSLTVATSAADNSKCNPTQIAEHEHAPNRHSSSCSHAAFKRQRLRLARSLQGRSFASTPRPDKKTQRRQSVSRSGRRRPVRRFIVSTPSRHTFHRDSRHASRPE